jgi:hypothetical protein
MQPKELDDLLAVWQAQNQLPLERVETIRQAILQTPVTESPKWWKDVFQPREKSLRASVDVRKFLPTKQTVSL